MEVFPFEIWCEIIKGGSDLFMMQSLLMVSKEMRSVYHGFVKMIEREGYKLVIRKNEINQYEMLIMGSTANAGVLEMPRYQTKRVKDWWWGKVNYYGQNILYETHLLSPAQFRREFDFLERKTNYTAFWMCDFANHHIQTGIQHYQNHEMMSEFTNEMSVVFKNVDRCLKLTETQFYQFINKLHPWYVKCYLMMRRYNISGKNAHDASIGVMAVVMRDFIYPKPKAKNIIDVIIEEDFGLLELAIDLIKQLPEPPKKDWYALETGKEDLYELLFEASQQLNIKST